MTELVVDDLGMRFGRRILFRRLGFTLSPGETLAVTGRNGAGKSTLLRILAGVLTPSKGDVRLHVGDRRVAREEHPLRVGLVAPYLNVYDGFSARENLAFLARARGLADADAQIEGLLELVDLASRAEDRVQTYSSGMKQRVKFAAALLADPPLLLLDEPSSNLDAAGLSMVDAVVARQRERGGLLVVATNVAEEAARCEREIRIEAHA